MPGAYGEAKVNVSGYDPPPKKKWTDTPGETAPLL